MSYKYVIFDFDGTIADTSEGVTASIIYALESYGIEVPSEEVLRRFFGPPLVAGFMKNVNVDEETAEKLTAKYRQLYNDNAMYLLELYDGMGELLERLKEDKIKMAIASSKPRKFFDRLLRHLEITDYFDAVSGASLDDKDSGKKEIIENACNILGVEDKSEVIMVGDRHYDINGAKEAGIKCIAVTFGFGSREEFEEAGADYIVDSPKEVYELIKNK